jgi:uncharacterized LabA/DUF88 family protein
MNTNYINLTELWQDGKYTEVANIINTASWSSSQFVEFCAYFIKYLGINELNVLQKIL